MLNKRIWGSITVGLVIFILPWLVIAADEGVPVQDITVIGVAEIGPNQDSVYQNAVFDAFHKAVDKVYPSQNLSPEDQAKDNAMKQDLVLAQKRLGITDYKVLRYWKDQNNFYVELLVSFGAPKVDQPRTSRVPKTNWVYQTEEQIIDVNNSNSILAVWTPQTIEVIAPGSGKRQQWIKTGLSSHSINGERYLIQDGDYLKLCNFTKFNAYNLLNYSVVFTWRKKIPAMSKFYLSDQAAYCIERSGVIRAYALKDGKEIWQIPGNSEAELEQLSPKYLLVVLPPTELWVVNETGVKLWVKQFDHMLVGKPVATGGEVFCLFKDGQLVNFNIESGQMLNSMNIRFKGDPQNVSIKIAEQKIFISYNDRAFKGHIVVYQRFTGSLLWEEDFDGPVASSLVILPDMLVIGVKDTLEARDPALGLKLWEENVSGQVRLVYWNNDRLLAVAGDRLYGYVLK